MNNPSHIFKDIDSIITAKCPGDQEIYNEYTSSAPRALKFIALAERKKGQELFRQLEMRFCNRHMEAHRNRYHKPGESLQEYQTDIVRLVGGAIHSAPDDFYENLGIEHFLDDLRNVEGNQTNSRKQPTC
ncbi:hypothetical protein Trydic_g17270 [Trypoxylus dichotomus]